MLPGAQSGPKPLIWVGDSLEALQGFPEDVKDEIGFALFQAPAPRVYSTGASVRDIIDYLLVQPGVSPSLAAQIRAIGDPSTTLPIPIPVDREQAQTVWIGGSPALAVGDETGVGAVVIWERAGMVYGVAGPLRESELLAVANSLTP